MTCQNGQVFSVAIFTCFGLLWVQVVLGQGHPPEGEGTKKLWVYLRKRFVQEMSICQGGDTKNKIRTVDWRY